MRKFLTFIVLFASVIYVLYTFYDNGYLDQTPLYDIMYTASHIGEEKIASPVATGDMLSFYTEENIGMNCEGNVLRVTGFTRDVKKNNLIIIIGEDGKELRKETVRVGSKGTFASTINLPHSDAPIIEVSVFGNEQKSGTFRGWVSNYAFLEKTAGGWQLMSSPVYEHNKELFTKPKPLGAATKGTRNIEVDNPSVKALAKRLTADCTTDYEKAAAIHDYICDTFYYDNDMASRDVIAVDSAAKILASNRGVCSGFANAYAALCRSSGIPCVVVTGYAVGMNTDDVTWTEETALAERPNHAWNEVYADGRWIIVDTTWDCGNSYEKGHIKDEAEARHLYFDANLRYFSSNHKILKYKDI